VIVAAYAAACSPRTRLVVVDRITSPTTTVLPVAAVAAAARAAGARVLVGPGIFLARAWIPCRHWVAGSWFSPACWWRWA
jgi:isopenicillin-N epimerase